MGGGESREREAGPGVGGQPTDDDPAAKPRRSNGQRGEVRMAAIQNEDPTPRLRDDLVNRRREGDSQLGQRPVTDIDAGVAIAETQTIKQRQGRPP